MRNGQAALLAPLRSLAHAGRSFAKSLARNKDAVESAKNLALTVIAIAAPFVASSFEHRISGTTLLSQREQAESQLRATGSGPALERLDGKDFWIHLDVDILAPEVMPAVDSPDPGGLSYAELETLLAALLASPRCVGMHVAIFDPDLDEDGRLAVELTTRLTAVIAAHKEPVTP